MILVKAVETYHYFFKRYCIFYYGLRGNFTCILGLYCYSIKILRIGILLLILRFTSLFSYVEWFIMGV